MKGDLGEYNVESESENTLTYWTQLEHVKRLIQQQSKLFFANLTVSIAGVFGILEIAKFYSPKFALNDIRMLLALVGLGFVFSLYRCIKSYCHRIPIGLEKESKEVQRIVRQRKKYWEYALFHQIVKDHTSSIDQQLTDILSNRVHVKVSNNLDESEYIKWLQLRPQNMTKLVEVAKQLLIRELGQNLSSSEDDEDYYMNIVRFSYLVSGFYRDLYDYEIESRKIAAPTDFKVLHEIQSGWVLSIRDGFHQMMEIVFSIVTRDDRDSSPVEGTIVFQEPPRIDEFDFELERLKLLKNI
ncbi:MULTISPECIES: hypothetical protein [Vibrio]|jgi:hypothetical protein|nr:MULTISPECIES: hypothetical protein [Vibrio]MDA0155548.1 hypothetical protein [Vibrio sp. Makdt]